ncbi:MAG: hypothetical protein ACRECT_02940 [Thermoplasmata archaeon]
MTATPLSELDALAAGLGGGRHDAYSQRALARAGEEFLSRRRPELARFTISADGKEYPNLYAMIADRGTNFETGEVRLDPAPTLGPAWRFLLPFERIRFAADGSADVHPLEPGPAIRGIARVLVREHYLLRSEEDDRRAAAGGARVELRRLRGTAAESLSACRHYGLVPFGAAVLVYLPEERYRYEFDLVHSTLLGDPRAGRLAPGKRVRRSSRFAWALDEYLARSDLSLLGARCLEVLAESPGLTSVELSHVFGGLRELVDSALQGLVQHRLVTFDRRTGVYRARGDAFLPMPDAPAFRAESFASAGDPALRTSVQELLAAADARATCPLCGASLPPGPKSILCPECAARVGAT